MKGPCSSRTCRFRARNGRWVLKESPGVTSPGDSCEAVSGVEVPQGQDAEQGERRTKGWSLRSTSIEGIDSQPWPHVGITWRLEKLVVSGSNPRYSDFIDQEGS